MRIAICFSGMIRAGIPATKNINLFLGDLIKDCDFFIHTWDIEHHNLLVNEEVSDWEANCPPRITGQEKLMELNRLYKFKYLEISEYSKTVDAARISLKEYISELPDDYPWWLPWFYSWHRSVLLKSQYENNYKFKYDYVIKIRPDVIFRSDIKLKDILENLKPNTIGINQLFYNNGDISSDDIFFVSSSTAADQISDWWEHRIKSKEYLDKTKSSLGYFYRYMVNKGFYVESLDLNYLGNEHKISLLREECVIFDAVKEYEKCAECNKLLYHVEYKKEDINQLNILEIQKLRAKLLTTRKHVPEIINENKLRIAICFSGMIRTGVDAAPAIKNFIGDLYNSVDFFIHTWDISSSKAWYPESKAALERRKQDFHYRDGRVLWKQLADAYDHKIQDVKIENFNIWNKNSGYESRNFSPQWYSWYMSTQLKSEYEQLHNFKYDVVIRLRPDIIYPMYVNLRDEIEHFMTNPDIFYVIGYNPARIDDVFFLSSSDNMDIASSFILSHKNSTWTNNIFGEYLESCGLKCRDLKNLLYTPLRPESIHIDLDKFHMHFNIDRDYYSSYNELRLNENNIEIK